jgi:hypothetical protein
VFFVHNHPGGDPTPSAEDVRFTADAARAGALLGIEVVDHVVLARGRVAGRPARAASLRVLAQRRGQAPEVRQRHADGPGGAQLAGDGPAEPAREE